MDEDRTTRNGLAALGAGFLTALLVYVLVAPFKCSARGTCDGLVAFTYQPDSAGHWQAIGAAALVGGAAALLIWLAIGSGGPGHKVAKLVATPLLVAGIGVSILSQSLLMFVGPLVGGLVLWFMWARNFRPGGQRNP